MNIATWPRPTAPSSDSSKRSITKSGCTRRWATARRPSSKVCCHSLFIRNCTKKVRALRMRFLRHDGIYRSDVSSLLINPVQMPPPVGRPRYQAIGRAGRNYTSCPSSAMSSDRLILDRVGRHQSPSPLHRRHQNKAMAFRRANHYHRTAGCVLTVCVSPGDNRSRHARNRNKKVRRAWFWTWPVLLGVLVGSMSVYVVLIILQIRP